MMGEINRGLSVKIPKGLPRILELQQGSLCIPEDGIE
jgi:hypothetical protein